MPMHFQSKARYCLAACLLLTGCRPQLDTYEVEVTEARAAELRLNDTLADDKLDSKNPQFIADLIDSRPLDGWHVNSSAAVIKLDVPMARPDQDRRLLTLHSSYAEAKKGTAEGDDLLVSINMVDGKGKQFDDGLYAALDQAHFQGLEGKLVSHVKLVRRMFDKLPADSPAAAFLAAGLSLAGEKVEVTDISRRDEWLGQFQGNEVASKPISFYNWTEPLKQCFQFLRFFQQGLRENSAEAGALAEVIRGDEALLADYRKALHFYDRLTNPASQRSIADMAAGNTASGLPGDPQNVPMVSLFPASTSREQELFEHLYAQGLPPNADLMRDLVQKIKSGAVDLTPRPNSGWYDHQVYALETFLLPDRGDEKDKLLLTKEYKQRMLEAFKAMLTTRRETHILHATTAGSSAPPPPSGVKPRLRIEPAPTYFLRTARAYAFLEQFLETTIGKDGLAGLHGLRAEGERKDDLATELAWMKDLFYGLHLISCEDIGIQPLIKDDEPVDRQACIDAASAWLAKAWDDPDLAVDRRISVPIFQDQLRNVTRLWIVVGVRLTRLDASYAKPPSIRAINQPDAEWKPVPEQDLESGSYLIAVDEFAEVELSGNASLTREELRAILDEAGTKEAAIERLRQRQ